jgi:hypothetical protein
MNSYWILLFFKELIDRQFVLINIEIRGKENEAIYSVVFCIKHIIFA